MVNLSKIVRTLLSEETTFILAISVLIFGAMAGYLVWRITRALLENLGVPEIVEGTVFERNVQNIGLSTVGIVAQLTALFVYFLAVFLALQISHILDSSQFWTGLSAYLPRLFIAALAVITGLVLGDKASVAVSEYLKSVKLPKVSVLSPLVKYSIFYIAALVAMGQLGVATNALLILLAVYISGILLFGALAFKDLLMSGAAGIYLLMSEPFSIGDEIEIGDRRGVVQEIDVFVTHIENDDVEYIISNQHVFRSGIVRYR